MVVITAELTLSQNVDGGPCDTPDVGHRVWDHSVSNVGLSSPYISFLCFLFRRSSSLQTNTYSSLG